jgi:ATP phosphoribosyltransferase
MITLALSKGRIFDDTLPLLRAAGIEVPKTPRRAASSSSAPAGPTCAWCWCAPPTCPPTCSTAAPTSAWPASTCCWRTRPNHDAAGTLYKPLDLGIARCRLSVAVRAGFDYAGSVRQGARIRVATKYTHLAREHFAAKGVHVDLIKLYGSMELAPLTGLADAIVDLVSTGSTLKANQLVEVEHIMDISARLVVNPAALKLKREPLRQLIDAFEPPARGAAGSAA